MTLYEAMRLGAMNTPQVFNVMSNGTGTCALGAVYHACGAALKDLEERILSFGNILPVNIEAAMWTDAPPCPECGAGAQYCTRVTLIMHLNDTHHWTRERIADWLEALDTKRLTPPEEVAIITA